NTDCLQKGFVVNLQKSTKWTSTSGLNLTKRLSSSMSQRTSSIHDPLSGFHFDRIIELPSVNYSRIALQQSNPQIKIIEINTMFAQAFLPFMPNISKATKVVLTKPSHSKPIAFCEQED